MRTANDGFRRNHQGDASRGEHGEEAFEGEETLEGSQLCSALSLPATAVSGTEPIRQNHVRGEDAYHRRRKSGKQFLLVLASVRLRGNFREHAR